MMILFHKYSTLVLRSRPNRTNVPVTVSQKLRLSSRGCCVHDRVGKPHHQALMASRRCQAGCGAEKGRGAE